jgi:glycosyltransferase involved in cell wall biosynthesis
MLQVELWLRGRVIRDYINGLTTRLKSLTTQPLDDGCAVTVSDLKRLDAVSHDVLMRSSESTISKPKHGTVPLGRRALRVLVMKYAILGRAVYLLSNLRQLIALSRLGDEVTFLVPSTLDAGVSVPHMPEFRLDPLVLRDVNPVMSPVLFSLKAFWKVLQSMSYFDCVILDAWSVPAVFVPLLFFRMVSRRPVVFLRVESNPVETGGALRSLCFSFLDTLGVKLGEILSDRVFFITPSLGQAYASRLRISQSKIQVWPSSVDMICFDPTLYSSSGNVSRLRKELGLSHRLGVLYHGALTKGRGVLKTVKAFRILKEESVQATLVLLGYGPLRKEIAKYVQENELQEVVQLQKPVDDLSKVAEYISACDAEIVPLPDHPWWRNQCSIKVLECLAMNKPLILSDIPGNRWVVGDAPVALYLKGTNARDIADGVKAFMNGRKNLDAGLGRQIAARFSVDSLAMLLQREILLQMRRTASCETS